MRHGSNLRRPLVHEGRCPAAREAAPVREHRWPGGQRQVAWLAECGGCRRAAHSCGSASVSHRLPPSPGRGPGTARNIRVARNRCREGTLVRRDDHHAISCADRRPSAAVARRDRRAADLARGRLAGVGARRGGVHRARAEPRVRRARDRDRVALAVSIHARPGPYARAFPLLVGSRRAASRSCACCSRSRTTHGVGDVLFTTPHFGLPQLLGGFTVGGTVELPVMLQSLAEGFAIVGVMARVRRVQLAWSRTPSWCSRRRVRSTRSGWSWWSGWRSCRRRSPRSPTCATPTAPAPAAGSCGADGCCARSCRCSSWAWSARSRSRSRWTRAGSPAAVPGPRDRIAGWCGVGVAARARRRVRRAGRRAPTPWPRSSASPARSGSAVAVLLASSGTQRARYRPRRMTRADWLVGAARCCWRRSRWRSCSIAGDSSLFWYASPLRWPTLARRCPRSRCSRCSCPVIAAAPRRPA